MMEGSLAPVSEHDTEEEARERLVAYSRGMAAAAAPTAETHVPRGERVTLRDGSEAIVRPVAPEDKPLFVEGFQRFGEDSRYQRFLGFKKQLSAKELAFFTELDHETHEALAAIDPITGRGLGVARFIREHPGDDWAEAAVAVVDSHQGRGLGRALLDRLAARAREVGVKRFCADLLTRNQAMLTLFDRVGELEVTRQGGEVTEIRADLPVEQDTGSLRTVLSAAARGDVGPCEP
jgi:GNAT superfamily N-acetyltransferase